MPFLHLQCLVDTPDRLVEVSSLAAAMDVPASDFRLAFPFDAPVSPELLDGVEGLTVGGSSRSVFDDLPHYAEFQALLQEARRRGLPTFGICFGAQALADAFGGRVVRNAARAEYGTIEVRRAAASESDPLFSTLPTSFAAQSWHRDRIVRPPAGAEALAWSQDDMLQAFALPGERLWGVQFHPERDADTFLRLLQTRTAPTGRDIESIRASLRPSPEATSLLAAFRASCRPRP